MHIAWKLIYAGFEVVKDELEKHLPEQKAQNQIEITALVTEALQHFIATTS